MSNREEIIAKVKGVPAMPTAAVRVSRLLRDPDVNIAELAKAIEHDPSLAANVLRVANSVYFAGPRSVGTIRDAIMRMGTKRVFGLTVASAIAPVAGMPVRGYDLEAGDLWKHSVATAVCSESLIEVLGIPAPNYTFTAALLHDIGKIVLGTFVEVDAAPLMNLAFEDGVPFEEAETRVLGINHPEVGAILLEEWKLPEEVVGAVRWHQEPEDNDNPGNQLIVDVVHAADALSLMGGFGTGSDGLNYKLSPAVAERLELSNAVAEEAVCKMLEGLAEIEVLFAEDWGR